MMALSLAASSGKSCLMEFLGSLHPGIVHFPIGLLAAAALFEAWQIVRRKPGMAPATLSLTILAALSAPPASLFGWLLAESEGTEGSTLELHRWLGIAASALAILTAIAAVKARTCPLSLKLCRVALFAGAGLVLATGYLGGEMVFGPEHIKWPWKCPKAEKKPSDPSAGPLLTPGKIDFATQVAPILKASCLKCHGGEKTKGKLKLTTKEAAMKGGENGKCIVPGDSAKSSLYTLLIDPDDDVRMPEKAKPLPKDQIELIKRWIDEGAVWPDGVTIK